MKKSKNPVDGTCLAIIGFGTIVSINLGGVYGAGFYLFGGIIGMVLYARIAKNMKVQEEEQ